MADDTPYFLKDATSKRNITNKRASIIAGVGAVCLLVLVFNLPQNDNFKVFSSGKGDPDAPFKAAMNRTLGFQTIIAITTNTTWRVQGVKAAANLTGIDVDFFYPREPPNEEVLAFRTSSEGHEIGRGKALAWLSHLDMLQHIADKEIETALIIEDDVDWDVYVREQMLQVARAFGSRQAVLEGTRKPAAVRGDAKYPYGLKWEVLWIGHNFDDMTGFEERERFVWHDMTSPSRDNYIGMTPWFDAVPEGHRALLGANGPVSTFAYAVTLDGARKLLKAASTLGEHPEAFDVRLAGICHRKEADCMMVAPELMHHHVPPEKEGFEASESVLADDGHEHSEDGETVDAISLGMGTTDNVVNSARCRALFNNTCMTGRD